MKHSPAILFPNPMSPLYPPQNKSDCSNFAIMIEVKKQLATSCGLRSGAKPCKDKWTVWNSLIYKTLHNEINKREYCCLYMY